MKVLKSFDTATLTQLREMPAGDALALLAIHVKADHSRRWHAATTRGEFELLTTGSKWYDTRTHRGGGGAIDLAMYVLGLSFVDAVKYLIGEGGQHGPDHP